jgi:hypothetical protein
MWKRKPGRPRDEARTDPRSSLPGLGVGVQVYVREQAPPAAADWVGEPTGVIVAPVDGLTTWLVAFSEPQWRRDGRGPYENAIIPSGLLVPAEPAE